MYVVRVYLSLLDYSVGEFLERTLMKSEGLLRSWTNHLIRVDSELPTTLLKTINMNGSLVASRPGGLWCMSTPGQCHVFPGSYENTTGQPMNGTCLLRRQTKYWSFASCLVTLQGNLDSTWYTSSLTAYVPAHVFIPTKLSEFRVNWDTDNIDHSLSLYISYKRYDQPVRLIHIGR